MTSPFLTAAQVKSFLKPTDLEIIEHKIATNTLDAEVINGEAIIVYKNEAMRLFDVMELIGSL